MSVDELPVYPVTEVQSAFDVFHKAYTDGVVDHITEQMQHFREFDILLVTKPDAFDSCDTDISMLFGYFKLPTISEYQGKFDSAALSNRLLGERSEFLGAKTNA